MTQTIVFIVVLFLIIALLWEAQKKAPETEDDSPAQNKDKNTGSLTADEALPTQTGRFRAQEVLQRVAEAAPAAKTERGTAARDKDNIPIDTGQEVERKEHDRLTADTAPSEDSASNPLPDPFDQNGG